MSDSGGTPAGGAPAAAPAPGTTDGGAAAPATGPRRSAPGLIAGGVKDMEQARRSMKAME